MSQDIARIVADDVMKRREVGIQTYGRPLGIENGRKALKDLYEELLDAAHYCKQEMLEREREALYLEGFIMLSLIYEDWRKTGNVPPDMMESVREVFAPRAGWPR